MLPPGGDATIPFSRFDPENKMPGKKCSPRFLLRLKFRGFCFCPHQTLFSFFCPFFSDQFSIRGRGRFPGLIEDFPDPHFQWVKIWREKIIRIILEFLSCSSEVRKKASKEKNVRSGTRLRCRNTYPISARIETHYLLNLRSNFQPSKPTHVPHKPPQIPSQTCILPSFIPGPLSFR